MKRVNYNGRLLDVAVADQLGFIIFVEIQKQRSPTPLHPTFSYECKNVNHLVNTTDVKEEEEEKVCVKFLRRKSFSLNKDCCSCIQCVLHPEGCCYCVARKKVATWSELPRCCVTKIFLTTNTSQFGRKRTLISFLIFGLSCLELPPRFSFPPPPVYLSPDSYGICTPILFFFSLFPNFLFFLVPLTAIFFYKITYTT